LISADRDTCEEAAMAGTTPEQTDRLVGEALGRGDVDAALDLFEPEAILVDPDDGTVLRGADEIRAAMLGMLEADISVTDAGPPRVLVAGDLALVLSRWTMETAGREGERLRRSGTATDVLRRQPDGTWRYVIDNPAGVETPAGSIRPG
jgi:uncharacterized protein (TIGR02246 family)